MIIKKYTLIKISFHQLEYFIVSKIQHTAINPTSVMMHL